MVYLLIFIHQSKKHTGMDLINGIYIFVVITKERHIKVINGHIKNECKFYTYTNQNINMRTIN